MKEPSLRFRFLTIVLSAIIIITVFVGGFCINKVDNYIQKESRNLIEITCENEAIKINDAFESMEKSVRIMENYVLSFFESTEDVKNRDKQQKAVQFADQMFVNVAKDTDDAIAYYLRLDPTISDSTSGVFYSKMNGGDEYVRLNPTDLALYDKNDTEHVGWYWQPYEAGKPIWMTPYYNKNNNVLMISYVVPLYYEDTFIGVVGMDFDYKVLTEIIQKIKIYEHGGAHLELNGVVIHDGTQAAANANLHNDAGKYLIVSADLLNGMKLVLSASYHDIRQIRYEIAYEILFFVLLFVLVFSLLVIFLVQKIVDPLKKLSEASVMISQGEYDVEIVHSNIREINLLSTTFENMIVNLREHKNLQHHLAHRDSLTGLRNTTSYKGWVLEFDKKIHEGNIAFGIIVLDINELKQINDTYGHILGNEIIVTASRIICNTFKKSPVFRIGGDEFLVLLQNKDLADQAALLESLDAECANAYVEKGNEKIPLRIAKGFSEFDPEKDRNFSEVFERADIEMYKNKRQMKSSSN